ncbi:MAG: myxosortase MrtC [Polyangiaceae bacterium]|jgi:membrane protease YdiL (CAAX protease family)
MGEAIGVNARSASEISDQAGQGSLAECLWAAADVTLAVGAIAALAPNAWLTLLVGATFLGATWLLVWRHDDACVRRSGLALGGLVIPGSLDLRGLAHDAIVATAWAMAIASLIGVPYFFGWRAFWEPRLSFSLVVRPGELADEVLGQVLVIALPEEAFYRGYLQSRLDETWRPGWTILGARVGPGWLVGAAIFAVGHIVTLPLPTRLAVFFPALVFGWLRARTGGIGASVVFHAFCNVYSQMLGRGYGVY